MKRNPVRILALSLVLLIALAQAGLAEYVSFTGETAASGSVTVFAPIGGTVDSVAVVAGQRVGEGDVLATLTTTKVYAAEAGTVTGIFGEAGDSVDDVAKTYGAVLYTEGESLYTIAASTENAYNSVTTKYVHVGEKVYLTCYSDGAHKGEGVITAIEGTDFTVRVESGTFLVGESVNVYRDESRKAVSRVGRGALSRTNPTSYTGTGSIVSFAVTDGQTVEKGDLLFETLDGSFGGLFMSGCDITSTASGIVAQLSVQEGQSVQDGGSVAVIYPDNAMWIQAQIDEADLGAISQGDAVNVEFTWNEDDEITYPGRVEMISMLAAESSGGAEESAGATYAVYISFTPDASIRYGMTAVVSTLDEAEASIPEAVEADAPDGDAADAPEEN